MSKNIVVCCDGTGNEVQGNLSNVLKLFRIVEKSDTQHAYYHPGVGTIGTNNPWARLQQKTKAIFGLATGYGLDAEIASAYAFICRHWEEGDKVFLFGFSRGAYTARAVAGFIRAVGLLPVDQLNLVEYALRAFKRAAAEGELSIAWDFGKIAGGRFTTIEFVGVWDTVASVIVPQARGLLPTLQTLPYTRTNPSVRVFRHAMSIDERRRMFRLNRWAASQDFVPDPIHDKGKVIPQDVRQVWFAGVHSDVGGGYPENESAPSKFPLQWMIEQAEACGLRTDTTLRRQLVGGQNLSTGPQYVVPNALAPLHDSLTMGWWILEWIPKRKKWREWVARTAVLGWYLPRGEPRVMDADALRAGKPPCVHESAVKRYNEDPTYRPVNWVTPFEVET